MHAGQRHHDRAAPDKALASAAQPDTDGHARCHSTVAIVLQWTIAAPILDNVASRLLRSVLPRDFFMLHVSSGITILLLTIVCVSWRMTHRPPPTLPMRGWERRLASGLYALLYSATLLLPPSSWALVPPK